DRWSDPRRGCRRLVPRAHARRISSGARGCAAVAGPTCRNAAGDTTAGGAGEAIAGTAIAATVIAGAAGTATIHPAEAETRGGDTRAPDRQLDAVGIRLCRWRANRREPAVPQGRVGRRARDQDLLSRPQRVLRGAADHAAPGRDPRDRVPAMSQRIATEI